MSLTYKASGVDIEKGDRLVDRIRPLAASTQKPWTLGNVGGFAGAFRIPPGYEAPVMVSGTDGVGTKLKLAFAMETHNTVGIDLVAMCVNDILTCGAMPLTFLDYFATGALDEEIAHSVIEGIALGCQQAGCALIGGETAELPGMYAPGEYDLAGFAVGVVEEAKMLDGSKVRAGDILLGLPSTGLHSNGYSLARKALLDHAGLGLRDRPDILEGESVGEAMLRPTRIYAEEVAALLDSVEVRAMCHITGGGLTGNLPRVLPEGLDAALSHLPKEPAIFSLIRERADIAEDELRRAFNLGTGFVAIVKESDVGAALSALETFSGFVLGEVVAGEEGVRFV